MSLFFREKPKIKVQATKKDGFSGWLKCTHCSELIHAHELEKNANCCPKCDYHYRISVEQRLELTVDDSTFEEFFKDYQPCDPLHFVDTEPYVKRLEQAQSNTGRSEAVVTGVGKIDGAAAALAFLDFNFLAGTMSSVVGEKITLLIELAITRKLPLVIFATSGGARMQESVLSLMQMAKTSAALGRLHEQGLLYISVLTNPTCGGTTASFATLGDILLAEPNALICFAGPRVIEQALKQKLPASAQKSEFLLEHGMIDAIIRRQDLKQTLSDLLHFFTPQSPLETEVRASARSRALPSKINELMNLSE